MNIRRAVPSESRQIVPLVYRAIHEIAYTLTATTDLNLVFDRLDMWVKQTDNRLSYENMWVAEACGAIVGVVISYHGLAAVRLDEPIQSWLRSQGSEDRLDVETGGDVLYIDSLAVDEHYVGKGIGTQLIQQVVRDAQARDIPAVTLNVDQTNHAAMKLYIRLGFQKLQEIEICGERFDYMSRTC